MNVTVFGAGYVGLVTGGCFAEMGNSVVCVEVDAERVAALQAGRMPIFEPGLEPLVAKNFAAGRLRFTSSAEEGVGHGKVLFVAVGTPALEDGGADLSSVLAVGAQIGRHMNAPKIIVNKSTVPVGTADRMRREVAEALRARGLDLDFDVVANPEFLKEGAAVNDFMRPDRVIIGASRAASRVHLERLYEPFVRNHDRFIHMNERSAELAKYAANAMLATRISLINELAGVAERVGADIEAVRRGLGRDHRIGTHFLYAGVGYGGACFPKDIKALIHTADELGATTQILQAVEALNQRQKGVLAGKMQHHYAEGLAGKTLALWGLAFKPNTDDMREAPSLVMIEALLAAGAKVKAYDPVANSQGERLFGSKVEFCATCYEVVAGAHGLVILTEWSEFRTPNFQRLHAAMKEPVIFDGRNLYDPAYLADLGFIYHSIGRPTGGA